MIIAVSTTHTHTNTGLVPPYKHYEPAVDGYEYDWRWAVGATPWGPYSNYSGVSELMQVCLSHVIVVIFCEFKTMLYTASCLAGLRGRPDVKTLKSATTKPELLCVAALMQTTAKQV